MSAYETRLEPPGTFPSVNYMPQSGKGGPDTPSGEYQIMAPRWARVEALLGGTETMKLAGETLLPKYARETTPTWERRLRRAVLYNYTEKVALSLSGKPFAKDIINRLREDIHKLCDNIDLEGNCLDVFAQDVFYDLITKGSFWILVDWTGDGSAETKADEQGDRPFFQRIAPSNVIAAYKENGAYTHVRVRANSVERVGYGEELVRRILVYTPETVETWEARGRKKLQKTQVKANPLGRVPIISCLAYPEGDLATKLPLQGVIDKNIEHWQSASDQRNCLTVARFPMLAASGVEQTELDQTEFSPLQILGAKNPTGKYYYVEHSGMALSAGVTDLNTLKAEMQTLAMDLLVKQFSRATATEKSLDAAEASAPLQRLTRMAEDALERAFALCDLYMGGTGEDFGDIEIDTQFIPTDQKSVDALIAAFNGGSNGEGLSLKMFLSELQRMGMLDPEFDLETIDSETRREEKKPLDKSEENVNSDNQGGKPEEEN